MYKLKELLKNINYTCNKNPDSDILVSGICSDSKKVTPASLFVCLRGIKQNSHSFINEVIKRGALVIVCEKESGIQTKNAIIIYVDNPRSAYAKILSNACKHPEKELKLIGITGTNGKTTVTHMIYAALKHLGKRVALTGTLGGFYENEYISSDSMTTPDPDILYPMLRKFADMGADYAVMEISSHSLELCKTDGLHFEVAAITNITPEHLDFHGNMENYRNAKSKIFTMCDTGIFCIDDEYTSKLAENSSCKNILKCSVINQNCDFFADDITLLGLNGCNFFVKNASQKTKIHSKIAGNFTVSNALLAFSVLRALGFSSSDASAGITSLIGVRGRMELLNTNTDFSVIIDFAHTPDALLKLLQSVHELRTEGQRIVTLFGCGGDRDPSKRSLMGAIASRMSDFVIITSDNSRTENTATIIDQILSGFDNNCPHISITDRREAIRFAVENADNGDIILLCGKGHEEYEIDINGKHPFSERDEVFSAINKFFPSRRNKNADRC